MGLSSWRAGLFFAILLAFLSGCVSTSIPEGAGEYIDDTVIPNRVKAAIVNEPPLKCGEIGV